MQLADRNKFFIIDPQRTLKEIVEEMKIAGNFDSKMDYRPFSLDRTEYTDPNQFREDDVVILEPKPSFLVQTGDKESSVDSLAKALELLKLNPSSSVFDTFLSEKKNDTAETFEQPRYCIFNVDTGKLETMVNSKEKATKWARENKDKGKFKLETVGPTPTKVKNTFWSGRVYTTGPEIDVTYLAAQSGFVEASAVIDTGAENCVLSS